MKYQRQISVNCFRVTYGVNVKTIIKMLKKWQKILRQKITSKGRSAWLLLKRWFLSKVEKFLIGKLQEEMEFRVSGLRN